MIKCYRVILLLPLLLIACGRSLISHDYLTEKMYVDVEQLNTGQIDDAMRTVGIERRGWPLEGVQLVYENKYVFFEKIIRGDYFDTNWSSKVLCHYVVDTALDADIIRWQVVSWEFSAEEGPDSDIHCEDLEIYDANGDGEIELYFYALYTGSDYSVRKLICIDTHTSEQMSTYDVGDYDNPNIKLDEFRFSGGAGLGKEIIQLVIAILRRDQKSRVITRLDYDRRTVEFAR